MLRILPGTSTSSAVVLQLEGQVSGRWVEALRHSCAEVLGSNDKETGRHLILDLAEVSFIDAAGLALFRSLSAQHVTLSNCSVFTAELLKGVEQEQ